MKCRLPKTSKKQDKIIHDAVKQEMDEQLDFIINNMTLQMIYVLHFKFGFGQKRLEQFAEFLNNAQNDLRERYELTDNDIPYLCERILREDGIDIDKLTK